MQDWWEKKDHSISSSWFKIFPDSFHHSDAQSLFDKEAVEPEKIWKGGFRSKKGNNRIM